MSTRCAVCHHPVDQARESECPACGASTAFVRLWDTLPALTWSMPAPTTGIVWKQSLRLCQIEALPDVHRSRAS
ncbi:MAG TPA: hypothetical protein PKX07_14760 [Aggregatilineales bacterium]|nr:hypothetical protein [Aggregatilineales bacterium]